MGLDDDRAYRRPDIEFKRHIGTGTYRTYGHIYWRPFIVHVLGHTIVGRRHLRASVSPPTSGEPE